MEGSGGGDFQHVLQHFHIYRNPTTSPGSRRPKKKTLFMVMNLSVPLPPNTLTKKEIAPQGVIPSKHAALCFFLIVRLFNS